MKNTVIRAAMRSTSCPPKLPGFVLGAGLNLVRYSTLPQASHSQA